MNTRSKEIQDYIHTHFCEESPATERARNSGTKKISVDPGVARTLYLIAKLVRPKRILEIGTFVGYSTLWLANALGMQGKLITIEREQGRYEEALENIALSDKTAQIEVIFGDAIEILSAMVDRSEERFDLVFIDGDNAQYPDYLEPVIQLTRSGGVILVDNLIPKRGAIGVPDGRDHEAIEIYLFNQLVAEDPRLDAHILPTLVGEEGRIDGLGVILVQ